MSKSVGKYCLWPPNSYILKLLITSTFVMLKVSAQEFSSPTVAMITVDVLTRLHSTCVYIIHFTEKSDIQSSREVVLAKEIFSKKNIAIGFFPIDEKEDIKLCGYNLPTFVLTLQENSLGWFVEMSESKHLSQAKWLIFLDMKIALKQTFQYTFIPLDCEFLVAQNVPKDFVSLTEIYHIHPNKSLRMRRVANWTAETGLEWTSLSLVQRRIDLLQAPVYISYHEGQEIYYIQEGNESSTSGFLSDMKNDLQQSLNITFIYKTPKDRYYGILTENGTWNGLLGMVQRSELDIALSLFCMRKDRLDIVDFLPPIREDKSMVFIRKTYTEEQNYMFVLSPFRSDMWTSTLLTIIILPVVLCAVSYAHANYCKGKAEEQYRLSNCFFFIFGIFCQQGTDVSPRGWPCRLVWFTAHVTALVVFVAYSATFISFLTVRRYKPPVTDFQDMLDDGNYKLGVRRYTSHEAFFQDSNNSLVLEVQKHLIEPFTDELNNGEGTNGICERSKYGYMTSTTSFRILAQSLKCEVQEVPRASVLNTDSIVITKRSPYRRLFSYIIQHFRRTGILKRLLFKHYPTELPKWPEPPLKVVELKTVLIFFVVLFGGIFVAIVILFCEIVIHRSDNESRYLVDID